MKGRYPTETSQCMDNENQDYLFTLRNFTDPVRYGNGSLRMWRINDEVWKGRGRRRNSRDWNHWFHGGLRFIRFEYSPTPIVGRIGKLQKRRTAKGNSEFWGDGECSGYIDQGKFHETGEGTPQGGIISPSLLNLTMRGFEAEIKKVTGSRDLVNVVVYADDFIVSARSKEILETEVKPPISKFLAERGLTLSGEKTLITHIDQGFDFLGFNVRRYEDKLLIKPAKKSVKSFLDNFRDCVASNKSAKTENLLNILNPKIMGWANYFRSVVSKKTFSYVDHQIFCCLWRWAKRRHTGRSKSWVWSKYFQGSFKTKNVQKTRTTLGELALLAKAASVPIVRHIKIKSDENPFDPCYQEYSSKLKTARKANGSRNTCVTGSPVKWS